MDEVITNIIERLEQLFARVADLERQENDLPVDTTAVSNPPTSAELNSVFGTPASLYNGFTAYVDNTPDVWLVSVVSGAWYYEQLTAAV